MNPTRQPNDTPGDTPIRQAAEELRTLRDLLRFTVSYFNRSDLFLGHGLPTAYDEAAYLILHTLHLSADQLEPFMDATLTRNERDQILRIIERRVNEKSRWPIWRMKPGWAISISTSTNVSSYRVHSLPNCCKTTSLPG